MEGQIKSADSDDGNVVLASVNKSRSGEETKAEEMPPLHEIDLARVNQLDIRQKILDSPNGLTIQIDTQYLPKLNETSSSAKALPTQKPVGGSNSAKNSAPGGQKLFFRHRKSEMDLPSNSNFQSAQAYRNRPQKSGYASNSNNATGDLLPTKSQIKPQKSTSEKKRLAAHRPGSQQVPQASQYYTGGTALTKGTTTKSSNLVKKQEGLAKSPSCHSNYMSVPEEFGSSVNTNKFQSGPNVQASEWKETGHSINLVRTKGLNSGSKGITRKKMVGGGSALITLRKGSEASVGGQNEEYQPSTGRKTLPFNMLRSSVQGQASFRSSKRNETSNLNGSYSINSIPDAQTSKSGSGLKKPQTRGHGEGSSNLQQLKTAIIDAQKRKSPSPKSSLFRANMNRTAQFKMLNNHLNSGRREASVNSSRVDTAAAHVYSHIQAERESCNTSDNQTARTHTKAPKKAVELVRASPAMKGPSHAVRSQAAHTVTSSKKLLANNLHNFNAQKHSHEANLPSKQDTDAPALSRNVQQQQSQASLGDRNRQPSYTQLLQSHKMNLRQKVSGSLKADESGPSAVSMPGGEGKKAGTPQRQKNSLFKLDAGQNRVRTNKPVTSSVLVNQQKVQLEMKGSDKNRLEKRKHLQTSNSTYIMQNDMKHDMLVAQKKGGKNRPAASSFGASSSQLTKKQKTLSSFKSPTQQPRSKRVENARMTNTHSQAQSVKSQLNESAHLSELVEEPANPPKGSKNVNARKSQNQSQTAEEIMRYNSQTGEVAKQNHWQKLATTETPRSNTGPQLEGPRQKLERNSQQSSFPEQFDLNKSQTSFMNTQQLDLKGLKNAFRQQESQSSDLTKGIQKRLLAFDSLKLRSNLHKKMKPIVDDPRTIPIPIVIKLIEYEGSFLVKFLQLSHEFRKRILKEFRANFKIVIERFKATYSPYLLFESSYLESTQIQINSRHGTRIDQVIKVKINPEMRYHMNNKQIRIGLQTAREEKSCSKSQKQNITFTTDCYKQNSPRWLWIHKEEREFHGKRDGVRSYTIPVMPSCVGDQIQLSITLISLMGTVDLNEMVWNKIQLLQLPNQDTIRNYNRIHNLTPHRDKHQKYFADLSRVCEVEDTVIEWFDRQYIEEVCMNSLKQHLKRQVDPFIEQLQKQFSVEYVEAGGIDFSVWKLFLRALDKPETQEASFYRDLNTHIRVVKDGSICNELKRDGILIDRNQLIEVRPRDQVLIYVSMGGFVKN